MSIHTAAAASALPRLPVSWKEFSELLRASQGPPKLPSRQEPIAKIEGFEKTRVSADSKESPWPSHSNESSDSSDVLDLGQEAYSEPQTEISETDSTPRSDTTDIRKREEAIAFQSEHQQIDSLDLFA
jgi:hypothetical protein